MAPQVEPQLSLSLVVSSSHSRSSLSHLTAARFLPPRLTVCHFRWFDYVGSSVCRFSLLLCIVCSLVNGSPILLTCLLWWFLRRRGQARHACSTCRPRIESISQVPIDPPTRRALSADRFHTRLRKEHEQTASSSMKNPVLARAQLVSAPLSPRQANAHAA